mmetsp:Transcript_1650/g.2304  ORF Transcript_1650/g.2304 Transcript_1650/m.2304 type:complete len:103 (-) Transcript_1650:135-443(-)
MLSGAAGMEEISHEDIQERDKLHCLPGLIGVHLHHLVVVGVGKFYSCSTMSNIKEKSLNDDLVSPMTLPLNESSLTSMSSLSTRKSQCSMMSFCTCISSKVS